MYILPRRKQSGERYINNIIIINLVWPNPRLLSLPPSLSSSIPPSLSYILFFLPPSLFPCLHYSRQARFLFIALFVIFGLIFLSSYYLLVFLPFPASSIYRLPSSRVFSPLSSRPSSPYNYFFIPYTSLYQAPYLSFLRPYPLY